MEGIVPFCGGCQRDITECTRFLEPPCSHFYCEVCLDQMTACLIDNTRWSKRNLQSWDQLKVAVDKYKRTPTAFNLNTIYEAINVNDVICKRAADPRHQRQTCKYHHSGVHESQPSEGNWICQKCQVKNDIRAQRCTFCLSLPRSSSVSRVQESPSQRSLRSNTPSPPVRVSSDSQMWVCPHCGKETSEDSYLCLYCDRTNAAVKQKLEHLGRNMQLCPTCKKLNTFTAARCISCKGPMHQYLPAPAQTPTWKCSFCNYANAELGSWICGKCSKTSDERKREMRAEGKEMVKCPNRRCQVLCSWGAQECKVCRQTLPQTCPNCGLILENGACRRCEGNRKPACRSCGYELIRGQCPNCAPQQQCGNCGLDMVQGQCPTCEARKARRCHTCGGALIIGRCDRCESRKTQRCPKCGRDITSAKCNYCTLSRSRSPQQGFGLSSLERPPLPEHLPSGPLPRQPTAAASRRSPSPDYSANPSRNSLDPVSRSRGRERVPPSGQPSWNQRLQSQEQNQSYKEEAEGQQVMLMGLVVFALLGCIYYLIAGR